MGRPARVHRCHVHIGPEAEMLREIGHLRVRVQLVGPQESDPWTEVRRPISDIERRGDLLHQERSDLGHHTAVRGHLAGSLRLGEFHLGGVGEARLRGDGGECCLERAGAVKLPVVPRVHSVLWSGWRLRDILVLAARRAREPRHQRDVDERPWAAQICRIDQDLLERAGRRLHHLCQKQREGRVGYDRGRRGQRAHCDKSRRVLRSQVAPC
mmetsp:Transcript_122362/g.353712  ORF Transcript_122362/g.353712 Transcript_122362/m.353712 type:complete len:212 (-) Transcript_122362:584-1219(-)